MKYWMTDYVQDDRLRSRRQTAVRTTEYAKDDKISFRMT